METQEHRDFDSEIRWRIRPTDLPRILRRCARCGDVRRFRSSGAFRVNANGRRLDVWLIYRCESCEGRWKLPVLERCPVTSVAPDQLERFHRNDEDAARACATDLARLRALGVTVEPAAGFAVQPEPRTDGGARTRGTLRIRLEVSPGVIARLDRILATGFGISRSALVKRIERGELELWPRERSSLRKPARAGQCIFVHGAQPNEERVME